MRTFPLTLCFILKKSESQIIKYFVCILDYLVEEQKKSKSQLVQRIYIEDWVLKLLPKQLVVNFWTTFATLGQEGIREEYEIDFLLVLGGDGTVLHALRLLKDYDCPPLIGFGLGSLCYLCQFDIEEYKDIVDVALLSRNIKGKKLNVEYKFRLASHL